MSDRDASCWVCANTQLDKIRESRLPASLKEDNFAITDSRYGETGELWRCRSCGFVQCFDVGDPVTYYEKLEDAEYEITRKYRSLQMAKILETIGRYCKGKTLLEIGAGSGILIEEALRTDWQAQGVEPSHWLHAQARQRNLPIERGVFPHENLSGRYDVIALIDVIEHLHQPGNLMASVPQYLKPGGFVVVVTPDVSSLAAKLLRWKWWHYRIAHIGYFNKKTLNLLMGNYHLYPIKILRPSWYFSGDYLFERVMRYVPRFARIDSPQWLASVTVPLNLFDSLLGIYQLKTGK